MSRRRRVLNLWRGRALQREFDEELQFHFDMRVERNLRQGMNEQDANVEARRHMGSALRAREGMHDVRVFPGIEAAWRDVAYAARVLRRQPAFTAVAVITLALGIGANTAVFSVLKAVWIDAVPFADPERLVTIGVQRQESLADSMSWDEVSEWRARNRSFVDIAGLQFGWAETLEDANGLRTVGVIRASPGLFRVFRTTPLIGRAFTEADAAPAAAPVVLLDYTAWVRDFGRDLDVVGRVVTIGGNAVTVVGVMPPDSKVTSRSYDLWLPFGPRQPVPSYVHVNMVVARLRPDVSLEEAGAEMNVIAATQATRGPRGERARGAKVVSLRDAAIGGAGIRRSLFLLLAASGLVLVTACANLMNLLLARGLERTREMAVRASIGAGRLRLLRQVVIEGTLIAAGGCVVGVAIAWVSRDALVAALPYDLPRTDSIAIDRGVLAFTALATVCTILLTSIIPALRASSIVPLPILTAGGSQSTHVGRGRIGRTLVAVEVALSLLVLTTAGLFVVSFLKLSAVDTGFHPEHLAAFRVIPPPSGTVPAGAVRDVVDALSGVPGVVSAAAVDWRPFSGVRSTLEVKVAGPESKPIKWEMHAVSPGYFGAMRMTIRAGRDFSWTDGKPAPPVVVINQRAAEVLWPGQPSIGKELDVAGLRRLTVIGVVDDIHHFDLSEAPVPEFYLPYAQMWFMPIPTFMVRTANDSAAMLGTLKDRIERSAGFPVGPAETLPEEIARSVHVPRFRAILFGLMALLVIVLASVGVFSVTAHVVAQRRREMGIRIAIGAQPSQVARMTLFHVALPVMLGVGLGFFGSLATTRLVSEFLFDTTPTDPTTFALVLGVVIATALVAAWVPARRSLRVDAVEVLRAE